MAAYYSSLSSQRGDLQSPCQGNQKDSSFPEMHSHLGSLTTYMQQASAAASYSEIMSGNSFSSHNAAEFPSVEARNEMMFIPPTNDAVNLQSIDGQLNTAANNSNGDPQLLPRMQISVLEGEQNFQCQGLSLSLGTQMQSAATMSAAYQYQYPNIIFPSSFGMRQQTLGNWTLQRESDEGDQSEDLRNSDCLSGFAGDGHNSVKTEVISNPQYQVGHKDAYTDTYLYGQLGKANTLLNSKYLKAAQQLLDEVVNVKKAVKQPESKKCIDGSKQPDQGPGDTSNEKPSDPNESTANSSSELSSAERQDLQNKKAKLLSMVDEVDRRYRQYYHQMQVVVSSLDMVAGHGAAKSYTALALQTISRHFRCLRDAISGQIEVIRKKLGEQDTASNGQKGIPRLRYVDHQLRQQRAFHQFGVMRHAWRPQRGLPESSVSILRAWLFEHFLHPYPNDSEKLMLARQTGLSRNQVANWFINARVRLWKPMVEEMYKEEFGESEENSKSALDEAIKAHGENHSALESRPEDDGFRTGRQVHDSKPNDHIPDLEMNKPVAKTMLQNWSNGDSDMDSGIMKFQRDQRANNNTDDHSTLYPDQSMPRNQNGDGSLLSAAADAYDISELSGFGVGSHVSLALGLQHHVNDAFSISGNNMAGAASSVGPDGVDYHCMDPGKQQDRFGGSHLLHDFVV